MATVINAKTTNRVIPARRMSLALGNRLSLVSTLPSQPPSRAANLLYVKSCAEASRAKGIGVRSQDLTPFCKVERQSSAVRRNR